MKQRCQNDFHCTFQHWLGSCRCAPPIQEPHRSLEGRQSAACQKFASHVPECWREKKKNGLKVILTCAPDVGFFLEFVLPQSRAVNALAGTLIVLSSILVCHFCPHGRLLGHLAGVRKFLSAFFHWKAAVHGAWVRGRVCFLRVFVCI